MTEFSENQVTQTIDWLSYTIPWHMLDRDAFNTLDRQAINVPRLVDVEGEWTRDIPLHGYEDAWINKRGGMARVMLSPPGHTMGVHIQLPGQALALMNPLDTLHTVKAAQASVTRIDIAVDVRGVGDPEDIYQALLLGLGGTKAQKFTLLTGTTGKTCYVGSRMSEFYLRVYDKAAQMGIEGHWVRIELECKGRRAKWVAETVRAEGYGVIPSMIKRFVGCPNVGWYVDALSRVDAPTGRPQPKKMTDTRAWLLGTVAKTLARETKENTEFLLEFLRKVQHLRTDGEDQV
uniref:Replication initiation protein-like C-terminal domain-containing protein n=1 Tax=uncultured prokaryote TaxID=198431 RepID=A0A0H5PZG6_9ZZZZ|nr:hypothetical protein [uncultured prokaryote]